MSLAIVAVFSQPIIGSRGLHGFIWDINPSTPIRLPSLPERRTDTTRFRKVVLRCMATQLSVLPASVIARYSVRQLSISCTAGMLDLGLGHEAHGLGRAVRGLALAPMSLVFGIKVHPEIRKGSPRARALNESGVGITRNFLANKSPYLRSGAR